MTNPPKRYLITSALPYANGQKHVGHLAGAYIPADIYVRYLRARKRDVVFVCGSDEHGTAIPIQAMKEGTTPQQIIDKYHAVMKQNFDDLSISFDVYDRTSSPLHHETAQEFFTYLNDRGDLEIKESEQYYDEEAKTFLADRYIKGTCPNCGFEKAFGDQCERCGTSLSPDELINPVSTLSGHTPVKKATQHWYLPLDKHEAWLKEWILSEHAGDWKTNVLGQCKSWIDAGLQPRAVTRDLDWGVKVPGPSPTATPVGVDGAKAPSRWEGEKVSESSLAEEETVEYRYADPVFYKLLKQYALTHRAIPTQAEEIMWEILKTKKLEGYKFRRQHIIDRFIADFVCLKRGLIVEIDGLIHALPENQLSDQQRTEKLNQLGFQVIRFTNEEVIHNIEKTIQTILTALDRQSEGNSVSSLSSPTGGQGAGKVLYVWFDAPIGYISATKQWALTNEKDWQPYWMDKDTKLVHFVGKDNIVFHCIIFPVMLKLHGFILPDNVPANEFMNLEGDKMSTSRGWKVDMQDYIDDFINKENGGPQLADALRYYLTTILPENKDSEFTWKGFQDAVNSELVAVFGNFIYRTMILMHKLCGGKVPKFHNDIITEKDQAIIAEIKGAKEKVETAIEEYRFRDALFAVIDLARSGNKYLQEGEPWIKAKQVDADGKATAEAQAQIDNCLHVCLQLCANLAILANPFLPNTAKKLCGQLKVVEKILDWENAGSLKLLSVGYSLREPELPFRKIEDEEITYQIEKLNRIMQESTAAQSLAAGNPLPVISGQLPEVAAAPTVAGKSGIVYDDFDKIDLRIGTIIAAEKVKKADKLLQLQVDLGFETRTIVSGIAQHFTPESLIGKQVIAVVNLAPRKMKGIESNGMILTAEQPDGSLILVGPNSLTQNGSNVK